MKVGEILPYGRIIYSAKEILEISQEEAINKIKKAKFVKDFNIESQTIIKLIKKEDWIEVYTKELDELTSCNDNIMTDEFRFWPIIN